MSWSQYSRSNAPNRRSPNPVMSPLCFSSTNQPWESMNKVTKIKSNETPKSIKHEALGYQNVTLHFVNHKKSWSSGTTNNRRAERHVSPSNSLLEESIFTPPPLCMRSPPWLGSLARQLQWCRFVLSQTEIVSEHVVLKKN